MPCKNVACKLRRYGARENVKFYQTSVNIQGKAKIFISFRVFCIVEGMLLTETILKSDWLRTVQFLINLRANSCKFKIESNAMSQSTGAAVYWRSRGKWPHQKREKNCRIPEMNSAAIQELGKELK